MKKKVIVAVEAVNKKDILLYFCILDSTLSSTISTKTKRAPQNGD